MFIWDYSAIFAVLMILLMGVAIFGWIYYTLNRGAHAKGSIDSPFFRQCLYCAYVYMDFDKQSPCRCPRCLSFYDA